MFWKPAESLRVQLLGWLVLPLLFVLGINAVFSYRTAADTANLAFDRLLLGSAEAIAEDIEFRNGELLVDLPYAALELLESNLQERIFYRVLAPGGVTVTGYDDLPGPVQSFSQESHFYTAVYRGERLHLVALKKTIYDMNMSEPVVVVVAETGESRAALSRQMLMEGLWRQSLLIVSAGALVWLGLVRGLRPLRRLRDDMLNRSSTDLRPIDVSHVPREVRPLIDAINQQTAKMDRLVSNRQRFVADAAHQMRTPLAEMRTQMEVCLRQNEAFVSRTTLTELSEDVERLSRLVSQLLLQARAEPDGAAEFGHEVMDLAELGREVAMDKVGAARVKFIDLSYDAPEHAVLVLGHPLLLRELIANLLDNAIFYTQSGGCVCLCLHEQSTVVLDVEDNGPGISEADREHVFERFYRGQGAALLSPAGSGLGLSIVRDIALAHGGSVELQTPENGLGLRVRVLFAKA